MASNCLMCGVGGQGVVLASKLVATAGIQLGMSVRTSETIGMAQRGGSVVSHVRMGENISSPIIPFSEADIIIAFEPAEAVRNINYLKKDGTVIVNKKAVRPVTDTLGKNEYDPLSMLEYLKNNVTNLIMIDGDAACEDIMSTKVLNVILLGAASATGNLGIDRQNLEKSLESNVNKKFIDINLKAVAKGYELIKNR